MGSTCRSRARSTASSTTAAPSKTPTADWSPRSRATRCTALASSPVLARLLAALFPAALLCAWRVGYLRRPRLAHALLAQALVLLVVLDAWTRILRHRASLYSLHSSTRIAV